jgi:hypothetical protein
LIDGYTLSFAVLLLSAGVLADRIGARGVWSERRDHFAGPLAVALLEHFLTRRWLRRIDGTRAVAPTPAGRRELAGLLGPALS